MTRNAIRTWSIQKHCRWLVFIQDFRIWFTQTNPGNNQSNSSYNSANVSNGEHPQTNNWWECTEGNDCWPWPKHHPKQDRQCKRRSWSRPDERGTCYAPPRESDQQPHYTIKIEMNAYAWTMMREPANRPVTPLQTIKAVISGDIAWKREPRQEPINERMRKGLLPYLSLIGPIIRRPTTLTRFRTSTD